jgi:hypothetical protein
MQKVEGSNPFIRSILLSRRGDVAEWLGTGLQNPLHRFKSGRRLLFPGFAGLASRQGPLYHDRPDGRLAQGESASLTRKRP